MPFAKRLALNGRGAFCPRRGRAPEGQARRRRLNPSKLGPKRFELLLTLSRSKDGFPSPVLCAPISSAPDPWPVDTHSSIGGDEVAAIQPGGLLSKSL